LILSRFRRRRAEKEEKVGFRVDEVRICETDRLRGRRGGSTGS